MKKTQRGSLLLAWLTLLFAILIALFWFSDLPFAQSVNEYIAGISGLTLNYILLTALFSASLGLWSLLRIIGESRTESLRVLLKGQTVFLVLASFHTLFVVAEFTILFVKDPLQPVRMGQWISFFSPILAFPALAAIMAATLPMVARAYHLRREQSPYAFVFVALWIFLWSAALWNPPSSVYRDGLPAKPQLIAHRGGAALAPENTLPAIQLAAKIGREGVVWSAGGLVFGDGENFPSAVGVETDIRISLDGTLFLMHDATLKRTTDIKAVFPDRKNDNASLFTLAELKQLNAGAWFLALHSPAKLPAGLVDAHMVASYQEARIPTLAEWLQVVRDSGMNLIFDLLPPPDGHPFAGQFFQQTLDQIAQANIASQVWFLVDEQHVSLVRAASPQFQLAYSTDYTHPPSLSDLRRYGYEIVNSEYGLSANWINIYRKAGIHVNIWTVDEQWQFSRLWLLGVNSVTTDNPAVLTAMQHPFLAIPYGWFVLAWCVGGALLGGYAVLRMGKWKPK
jgi:glycerophosphoryl diester phosphodiesterase